MNIKKSLAIISVVAAEEFRTGGVVTNEVFKFGKYETRMKCPNKKGSACGFRFFNNSVYDNTEQ